MPVRAVFSGVWRPQISPESESFVKQSNRFVGIDAVTETMTMAPADRAFADALVRAVASAADDSHDYSSSTAILGTQRRAEPAGDSRCSVDSRMDETGATDCEGRTALSGRGAL